MNAKIADENVHRAAALATSCKIKVKTFDAYYDVRENGPLGAPPSVITFADSHAGRCRRGFPQGCRIAIQNGNYDAPGSCGRLYRFCELLSLRHLE